MQLPVYAHPTLTVLVDDSDTFLRSLAFQLDPARATKTFHDTTDALHWLRSSACPGNLPLQVNFDTHNLPADQCNVALDLARIYRIAEKTQRFALPTVLVVDYSMPQMNGLEFCAAVAQLPFKKILFTGAADEKIAVSAFNRGLIDRYIKKSDSHALDLLEMEIAALQDSYFDQRSDTLRELLLLHDYSFLSDPALALLVRDLKRSLGFVEHYIFPNPAGIVFLDRHGKATLMVIETEQGMQTQYEIARDSDAPRALLCALVDRRVLTFFSDPRCDGMYHSGMRENWHRYSAALQICQGREAYYWALFDLPAHYFQQPPAAYAHFQQALKRAQTAAA
jgi:CheY-like chemotaxis protein